MINLCNAQILLFYLFIIKYGLITMSLSTIILLLKGIIDNFIVCQPSISYQMICLGTYMPKYLPTYNVGCINFLMCIITR